MCSHDRHGCRGCSGAERNPLTGGTTGGLAATLGWACWRRNPTICSAVMPAARAVMAESRVMVPTKRFGSSTSERTNTRRMDACTAEVV